MNSMCFILFTFSVYSVSYSQHEDSLELVFAIFRHGHRTSLFETNEDNTYRLNKGELTNKGKREEYFLGKQLRYRYSRFLGRTFTPGLINGFTTDFDRTKMTLQLILAGLFPPVRSSALWFKRMNWQPIPFKQLSDEDHRLSLPLLSCPKYLELYDEYMKLSKGQEYLKKYRLLVPQLNSFALKLRSIFYTLDRLEHFELEKQQFGVPNNINTSYLRLIEAAGNEYFLTSTATAELKKFSGGFLLKNIINDIFKHINGTLKPSNSKMFLYAGHDYNLVFLLNTLQALNSYLVSFGAYIIIEVHKISEIYGIKILYGESPSSKLIPLKIPNCDTFCPIETFVETLKDNLPPDEDDPCGSTGIKSTFSNFVLIILAACVISMKYVIDSVR